MLADFLLALLLAAVVISVLFFAMSLICRTVCYIGTKREVMTVIFGVPGQDNLCEKVYCAFLRENAFTLVRKHMVYVIDLGVSEDDKHSCISRCGRDGVRFVTPDELCLLAGEQV